MSNECEDSTLKIGTPAFGDDSRLLSGHPCFDTQGERIVTEEGGMHVATEVKQAVIAADQMSAYDEKAKRVIGNKWILAHILMKTVDEFKGMHPEEVVSCMEGDPYISVVPVEPGLTNIARKKRYPGRKKRRKKGSRIVGLNTENTEINEGMVRFDIVFYVRTKDGLAQIIINLEIQKDTPSAYHLLNRAIFYVCRLVSSQKERDFVNMNYDDIRQVYSIWICKNRNQNSMNHYHLADDKLIGDCEWKGKQDMLNIVLIGLAEKIPEHDEEYELHRLLGALLTEQLTVEEKLDILQEEYGIPIEETIREDVNVMCNLSEGLVERAETRGREEGS